MDIIYNGLNGSMPILLEAAQGNALHRSNLQSTALLAQAFAAIPRAQGGGGFGNGNGRGGYGMQALPAPAPLVQGGYGMQALPAPALYGQGGGQAGGYYAPAQGAARTSVFPKGMCWYWDGQNPTSCLNGAACR